MSGRPEKHYVDFFSHYNKVDQTVFILQSRYRNDGYAFWYKLLEILSATDYHFLDLRNPKKMQFLLATTLVDEETGNGILKLLSELEAIDTELWEEKIIWVQTLVDKLTGVYERRNQSIPSKPIIDNGNVIIVGGNSISDGGNTQTKLNQTKLNQTKENKIKSSAGGAGGSVIKNINKSKKSKLPGEEAADYSNGFVEYFNSLRDNYKDLDYDTEFIKFKDYWKQGTEYLVRPTQAWSNWLDKARQRLKDQGPSRSSPEPAKNNPLANIRPIMSGVEENE